MITGPQLRALDYVKNTNGGASFDNFVDDHEPIGGVLWRELLAESLVQQINGRIYLTMRGEAELMKSRRK